MQISLYLIASGSESHCKQRLLCQSSGLMQLVDKASAARRSLSQDAEITKHWNVSLSRAPGLRVRTVLLCCSCAVGIKAAACAAM